MTGPDPDGGNSRNGHRTKTVLTEVRPVDIDVPRDRNASFIPTIAGKRRRRVSEDRRVGHLPAAKGIHDR